MAAERLRSPAARAQRIASGRLDRDLCRSVAAHAQCLHKRRPQAAPTRTLAVKAFAHQAQPSSPISIIASQPQAAHDAGQPRRQQTPIRGNPQWVPACGWIRRTAAGASLSTHVNAAPRAELVVLHLIERAGPFIVKSLFSLSIQ